MTTLQKTLEELLKLIYNDSRVNTKKYSEKEALLEIRNAIDFKLNKISKHYENKKESR